MEEDQGDGHSERHGSARYAKIDGSNGPRVDLVSGDFNMNFLDTIKEVDGLKWTGNANELNSAYAADGYARVKGIPGCLVTTHGVGELSAINGIAGAASEMIPVIHSESSCI